MLADDAVFFMNQCRNMETKNRFTYTFKEVVYLFCFVSFSPLNALVFTTHCDKTGLSVRVLVWGENQEGHRKGMPCPPST